MGLPQLKQAMEEITILPPAFRFEDAMAFVKTVSDFNSLVETMESSFAEWRSRMVRETRDGLRKMEHAATELPRELYAPMMVQFADISLKSARDGLITFSGSFADRPDLATKIREVRLRNPEGARFMMAQVERMDALQKKNHETCLLLIGMLRTFRSRYDDVSGDGPNGVDEAAYLSALNDRYSVVNAKLAQ